MFETVVHVHGHDRVGDKARVVMHLALNPPIMTIGLVIATQLS